METSLNRYKPDYVVPPGWILEEYLEARDLSPTDFARQCGCPLDLIVGILSGKARLDSEMALRFEKVLGLDVHIWLGIESNYRAPQRETERQT